MSVGVIAGDAVFEPENVCYAEVFAKDVLVIFLCEARISFLDFAQKAFFGGEKRASCVDVNASAFENDEADLVVRLLAERILVFIDFSSLGRIYIVCCM